MPIESDVDLDYLEIEAAHYPESTLLYLGWTIGAVQATVDGEVLVQECRSVAATPDAWVCEGDDEAVGRAPDGTELWSGPWNEYYLIDEYQHIAPVVLTDNGDGSVSAVDPLTGEHGTPIPVGDGTDNLSLVGDADHVGVTTDSALALLDLATSSVLWQTDLRDEYLNIAGAVVIDDVLVMDAESTYGFDLATGDILWERDLLASELRVRDGALVGADWSELIRYELP